MPKTDIDYSNTIIYKITCKDPVVKDVYVGHTTNFVQRKHAHKQSCINIKSLNYSCKLYKAIRSNGGWNNWSMEIVGFFNCKDHYEAMIKEQEYFEILHATLNSIEPMPKPKLKIEKPPPTEKKIYYCEICEVKLQNLKCMEIHNQSNKHIKKQKQIAEQDNLINRSNTITVDNDTTYKHQCKICDYHTSKLFNFNKHNLTLKHQLATKQALMAISGNIKNVENNFCCEICNFNSKNKTNYDKHLLTSKHNKNISRGYSQSNYICEYCDKEYTHYNALWKHKKKCELISNEETNKLQNTMISNMITPKIFLDILNQSKELQNVLIEQTKELQNKLLEKEDQLIEQNKQLIEMAKKPSMVNSNNNNNNNNNNQFNLNFFLNETCKNAMNIQDFINSIKLTTQDFETTGKIGFVDGISRIFINELKRIEVERRPLHCTDVKRETVYVKDNDSWEKENLEKKKLKWAINSIAQLNLNQVQQWQEEYPECRENNTTANTRFNEMAMVALGGFGDEQIKKFDDKIMKNVLKEVVVSKEIE
jgi:hypothetical protein